MAEVQVLLPLRYPFDLYPGHSVAGCLEIEHVRVELWNVRIGHSVTPKLDWRILTIRLGDGNMSPHFLLRPRPYSANPL